MCPLTDWLTALGTIVTAGAAVYVTATWRQNLGKTSSSAALPAITLTPRIGIGDLVWNVTRTRRSAPPSISRICRYCRREA
jgi:hypothetical protein